MSFLQESHFCFASAKRECMLTSFFMPPERQPFIYRPRRKKVTAAQAMDLVRDKAANCHQFDVNPHDAPPSVDSIAAQITELSESPQDDSEAALAIATLQEAMQPVQRKAYGVASLLAKPEAGAWNVITVGQNHRVRHDPREYTGHAETCMVQDATQYLQQHGPKGLTAFVNLCPCPGCMGPLIDAHIETVLIGTIDPRVGAAFGKGMNLEWAVGIARQQVMEKLSLIYRAPNIADAQLRARIHLLCWDVFHATRGEVHRREHGSTLVESGPQSA
jgi:tRNA(Arg) A34 adenosine deaminase TadA